MENLYQEAIEGILKYFFADKKPPAIQGAFFCFALFHSIVAINRDVSGADDGPCSDDEECGSQGTLQVDLHSAETEQAEMVEQKSGE